MSVADLCACEHGPDLHEGERGACRACGNDVTRARCLSYRPPRSSRGLGRSTLRGMSDGRRDLNVERARRQRAAWGPPPWKCALSGRVGTGIVVLDRDGRESTVIVPPCRGQVHGHEILSRARAGRTDENLLDVEGQEPVCNRHNSWLTQFSEVPGLVEHSWTSDPRALRGDQMYSPLDPDLERGAP